MLRVAISFDYDSPAGYRESFHMRDFPANADYEGTNALLKVLRKHDVKVTFGIVGEAALPGEPWDRCQEQIRAVHREGHEIASHSMTHRYLASMRDKEVLREAVESKRALEECTGEGVLGFIPPFNRPSHFPEGGAFSVSELCGLSGRGRGRQSIGSMMRILGAAGYAWGRVSFEQKLHQLGRRLGVVAERPPRQPFMLNKMVAISLHQTDFALPARALIRRWLDSDLVLTLYGHPNQAFSANGQNANELDGLLSEFRAPRDAGKLEFSTLGEIATYARGGRSEPRVTMLV